jgi:hypothetical protein
MLTQCLIQLLHAQPTLCEHLPSIGFLPSIIQSLECKTNGAIVASGIKVLFALCKSDVCLQTFSTKCPQIISGFKQAMQTRRDHLGNEIQFFLSQNNLSLTYNRDESLILYERSSVLRTILNFDYAVRDAQGPRGSVHPYTQCSNLSFFGIRRAVV